jgi:hypothetical protein
LIQPAGTEYTIGGWKLMLRCVPATRAPAQVPHPAGQVERGAIKDDRGDAEPAGTIGAHAPAASTAMTIATAARAQVLDS